MTATEPRPLVCPKCGNRNTTVGASGNAMCLDCAAMWDPDAVPAPVVPILAPFGMAPVDEVFGAERVVDTADYPATTEGLDAFRRDGGMITDAHWWAIKAPDLRAPDTSSHPSNVPAPHDLADDIGGRIVLEGGQEGFVIGVVDDEHVEVILPDDRTEVVALADVHAIYAPPDVPDVPADETAMDALAPDMRAAFELAKIIVRAGVESVNGSGETITPGVPPAGYLDVPLEMFPVVERAAALAVGMILELLDADVDAVLLAVGAVKEQDDQGDPQTEGTDNGTGTDTDEW